RKARTRPASCGARAPTTRSLTPRRSKTSFRSWLVTLRLPDETTRVASDVGPPPVVYRGDHLPEAREVVDLDGAGARVLGRLDPADLYLRQEADRARGVRQCALVATGLPRRVDPRVLDECIGEAQRRRAGASRCIAARRGAWHRG